MLFASLVLTLTSAAAFVPQSDDPFPAAPPESVGLAPAALAKLAETVRALVAQDALVGAELLVIKNDHTVLHEAMGWKDREEQVAMPLDAIFCVRSMTKPVVGTAVELLLQDSKLGIDDPASKYLPSFDNEKSRAITIRQLLHHTSGLRLSSLLGRSPSSVDSVREVADLAGAEGPDFAPGEHFSYSDDGADTLGSVVEVVAGMPLAQFLAERVFTPLGMGDALAVVTADHPLRARVASNYLGGPGSWQRYWSAEDPPLFHTLLASQGLYCSPRDYARFLALWEHRGNFDGARLLRATTCRRALAPGTVMGYPTGFEGVETHYGELWMVYVDKQETKASSEPYAFGHNGSDGTFAWVFPKLDLMVLCFTQSRGAEIGTQLEAVLQHEIVDPLLHIDRQPVAGYTEAELQGMCGWFWDPDREDVLTVSPKGARLELEIPGTAAVEFEPTSTRDHWRLVLAPDQAFDAERAEDGTVRAWIGHAHDVEQRFERWKSDPSWPSVDEVLALRKRTNDWEKLPALGMLRAQGKIEMPALKVTGTFVSCFEGLTRYRLDLVTNRSTAQAVRDGERVWTANSQVSGGKPQEGDEATRARMELASPVHVAVDWRGCFRELSVLGPVKFGDKPALALRGIPARGRGRTLIVDAESGLLLCERIVQLEPGLGEIGATILFDDWRAVEGVQLPFRITVEHPTPLLGTYESTWESVETHVALEAGFFDMR